MSSVNIYVIGRVKLFGSKPISIEVTNDYFSIPNKSIRCEALFIYSNLDIDYDYTECEIKYNGSNADIEITNLSPEILSKLNNSKPYTVTILKMRANLDMSDIGPSTIYFVNDANTYIYAYYFDHPLNYIIYMIKYGTDLSLSENDLEDLKNYFTYIRTLYELSNNQDFKNLIKKLFFPFVSQSTSI